MTEYVGLNLEKRGHVALVTLSNPPAHTWTQDSLSALTRLVGDLERDHDIYSLVITGDGQKFFSAGADLKLFADGDKATARTMARRFGEAFEALANFRGLTIAAINGFAMGGGLECALACDLRICEEHAQMGLPEATVGLLPCAGGSQWLARHVGASVLGVNINARQVEQARRLSRERGLEERVQFHVADFCATELAGDSFDVVWALESACYAEDTRAFLAEAYRLLKAGIGN